MNNIPIILLKRNFVLFLGTDFSKMSRLFCNTETNYVSVLETPFKWIKVCGFFFFFTRYWTVIKEGCICLLVSNTDNEFPRVHSHTLWYITLPVKIGKRENSTQLSISWTDHDDPTISYVFIWHILIPNPELLSSYPPKSDHRRDCKLPLRSCLRLFTLLLMPKPPTIKPGICDM